MKNNLSSIKILLTVVLLLVSLSVRADVKTFSQTQVVSDFDALYHSLIDTHYNPYAYVSEQELADTYRELRRQLTNKSYSLLDTISHFQKLVAALNNGHTEIDFPVASYLHYAEQGGTLFPLDLAFENDKAWVRANFSNHPDIPHGAELIAINGEPIDAILNVICAQISAERRYFKLAKLEVFSFPRYYWYAFGERESYLVTLRVNGESKSYTLKPVKVFEGFEEKKDEVLRAQQQLVFYPAAAYLNPGHFSGDEEAYKRFIDNAFSQIHQHSPANLIIDLRNNSGGNDSFSDYLVAYLADKPFRWASSFKLRTSELLKQDTRKNRDLSDPYWQAIMAHKDGEQFDFAFEHYAPVSADKRFKGKVFVLVNRQTHSQASVTAAQIQDYGWATIVGEETGDYPTLYASQFQYALPMTDITVKISKGYIVRVNGSHAEQGVIPSITIRDHLLDNNDEILNVLLADLDRAKNTIWQRAISKWNLGLLDDALIDLERYLEINPKDAEAYYWMGKIAEEMHNDSLSAKFFRSAVELKPDYSEAKKCLKELLDRNK